MSLHYHLVQRTVPAGEDAGKKKYFGQVRSGNVIEFDEICSQISTLSTANKGEVCLVLCGLVESLVNFLKAGHIVQMGDMGNFRPSAGSDGAATEKEFTMNLMRTPRVVFSPGKVLRDMLSDVGFRRLELKIDQRVKPCDKVHLGE